MQGPQICVLQALEVILVLASEHLCSESLKAVFWEVAHSSARTQGTGFKQRWLES